MILEIVIFLAILVYWWKVRDDEKHKGCPPGPFRFPFVGNMPQLFLASAKSAYPTGQLLEVTKSFGDVVTIQMGLLPAVVVSSQKAIAEGLSHPMTNVSRGTEKIPSIFDKVLRRNLGVIWSTGETWETHRRYTIRTLRDFGFGKSVSMDFAINEEFDKFSKEFNQKIETAGPSGIVKFEDSFDVTVISILWRLVTGVSHDMREPKMVRLLKYSKDLMRQVNLGMDISMAFPFLYKFLDQKKDHELRDVLQNYCRETVAEFRKQEQYRTDPQCLVDVYLERIDKEQEKDKQTTFTDDMLMMILFDLLQAGTDTTSNSLSFAVVYMILNPEVQRKVQAEIDAVVPQGEPITMDYKGQLKYCMATVMELHRRAVIVPSLTRDVTEDFYVDGYLIKKGTMLITNLEAMRMDQRLWGDPENFRPERFLTKDGSELDQKMVDLVLQFGTGKRMCLGYQLAEASLFLYFTSLMRAYKFEQAPGRPKPSTRPQVGITYNVDPFEAKVTRRNKM